MKKSRSTTALLILLLCGVVLGGFIGTLASGIGALSWLDYGQTFGLTNPLMLDLGDGYYQNLLTGEFYKLAVGSTWPGSADDAATYGELCWTKIGSLPSAPPMDWGSRERST